MSDADLCRELELILNAHGGAELLDYTAGDPPLTAWASDSDEDFKERFPDFLHESDVAGVLDYLIEAEHITEDEAESLVIDEESFEGETAEGGEGDDPLEGEFDEGDEDEDY